MVDIPEGIEHIVHLLEGAEVKAAGDLCIPLPCAWVSPAGLTPMNMCGGFTLRVDVLLMAKCVDDAHCDLSKLLTRALTVLAPIAEIDLNTVVNHPLVGGEVPAYRLPVEVTLSDC